MIEIKAGVIKNCGAYSASCVNNTYRKIICSVLRILGNYISNPHFDSVRTSTSSCMIWVRLHNHLKLIWHVLSFRYSTPQKHSVMMSQSLLTVITTSALLSSSITAVSQDGSEQLPSEITDPNFVKKYGHLVSLHQPVSIEPPEVTCTQGNITLDRSYLSSYYNGTDITYHCAAKCSGIYPIPRKIIFRTHSKLISIYQIYLITRMHVVNGCARKLD